MLSILLSVIILVAAKWKFSPQLFSVPVSLNTGETALITGSLPDRAWLGNPVDLTMKFQFTTRIEANQAQIRAEIVIPDVGVSPNGQITLRVDPAQPVSLSWEIKPERVGYIDGTLWVNSSTTGGAPQAVLAKRFQIQAIAILGISAVWMGRIGWGFLVIGVFYLIAFSARQSRSKG